ncbi:MAG: hypothetical protein ACI9LG_000074 [Moritella dasanensis]|jgi:hypothetical protein
MDIKNYGYKNNGYKKARIVTITFWLLFALKLNNVSYLGETY